MPIAYLAERPEHADAIEGVLNRAFGPGRFAKTSERVRERGAKLRPELTRVATLRAAPKPEPLEAGRRSNLARVLGVCRIYDVRIGGAPFLFLGPLAVDPGEQHHGVGAELVRSAVKACGAAGGAGVICVGAAAFFMPLGFSVVPPKRVTLPGPVNPSRLLWIGLSPGGLDRVRGAVTAP